MLSKNTIHQILNSRHISEFHKIEKIDGIVSPNPRFLTVVIDISNRCNLRCRMCYFSHDKYFKADPVFISPDTFEKMAENLLPHAITLTLSCGSEPLVSPYFIDILKIASRHKVPHLDFATNGMLLTKRNVDAIIKYGVTGLMLSIDAPSKKTFEYVRRGASFDKVIGNIKYLVEQKEIHKSLTPALRFNITLMRSNIEEVESLVDLAAELKVSYLDFRHLVIFDGLGMESESLVHYKELSNCWLKKARERAEKLGLTILTIPQEFGCKEEKREPQSPKLSLNRVKRYINILTRNPIYFMTSAYFCIKDKLKSAFLKMKVLQSHPDSRNTVYCNLPFTYTLINSGGHVLPCPHCYGVSEYGTISPKVSFEDVWFNEKFRTLRERILINDPPKMCKVCSKLGMYNIDEEKLSITREF